VSLRVIAGSCGGRRLALPKGADIRPTSDQVREAVFGSLGSRVVGVRVLDLCAGTGAMAIEALSRGAESATLVERDRRACAAIAENLTRCGLSERARVARGDALRWLDGQPDAANAFDLVIADPPYASRILVGIAERLSARPGLVSPRGLVVFEAGVEDMPRPAVNLYACARVKRYGSTFVAVFERAPAAPVPGDP